MRKSLILILLFLALSAGGICYAHHTVNSAEDTVALTETTLIGDISAAKDLSVRIHSHCQNHLFWDTVLLPGQLPATDFLFSQSEIHEEREQNYSGVQIYLNTNMGMSSTGSIDLTDANTGGLAKIFEDIAGRTENGTTYREKVYFKDYYDLYPIEADLFLPGYRCNWAEALWEKNNEDGNPNGNDASFLMALADYFRFPVLEDHQLEITVVKDDAGNIVELNSSGVEGCDVWFNISNAITDDSCYFAVSAMAKENVLMDYSQLPFAHGIYRLPCGTEEEPIELNIDDMEMVYPLESTEQVALFQPNADKTKLLLVTQEESTYILKVLDAKTAQELQRIPLTDVSVEDWMNELYVGEDFLVMLFGEKGFLVLQEKDNGNYDVQYSGTFPDTESFSVNRMYDSVMAFDGERLAAAAFNYDENNYGTTCGFTLVICDETGVLYTGRYDSSLDTGYPDNRNERCAPVDDNPLEICWN